MVFSKGLAGLRQNYVGSRRVFADKCGYTVHCIKTWERGERVPSPRHLEDVLVTLASGGASPCELRLLLELWLTTHHLGRFF